MNIKAYLKALNNIELENLFKKSFLSEEEYWLLKYTFIQKRMVENICAKLNISKSAYHNKKNVALAKVENTYKNLIN